MPTKHDAHILEINVAPEKELHILYMSEKEFYDFCAANPELRVEREKDGKVIVMSPVGLTSSIVENEISSELRNWNKQTKLGKAFNASGGFKLPDGSIKAADAAWMTKAKWKALPPFERKKFSRVVPDFVAEVRSTTDALKKLKTKMEDTWIENGVRLAWLIDPSEQKTYVYRIDGSIEVVNGFEHILPGEDVLPGFEFDLSLLLEDD
ncbi:MAG TPA: Uma2 family endonuclease [Bacteroidetes bacterium]|nr:Uma2 family endonuclease [Bacteroidota bacterium]